MKNKNQTRFFYDKKEAERGRFMAGKIISIEIGSILTKICEMEQKEKNPKIYQSFIVETPEGILEDGMLIFQDSFVQKIKDALEERKIKGKQVVFTVASTKIASREVFIPFVKENRIVSIVQSNAATYFPVDVTKYQFSHHIIGVETDDKGNKQYKLLVLAAPNQLLESYKKFAQALNLEVLNIDYIGNSMYQAVKGNCEQGTHLIMKVDEFSTLLLIIKNGVIALTRTIPYGISEGIYAMLHGEAFGDNLTFLDGINVARMESVLMISDILDEDGELNPEQKSSRKEITYALSSLVGGIVRVIDYYNTTNAKTPIDQFWLTGIGSDLVDLDVFLSQAMNLTITNLTYLEGMELEKSFNGVGFGEFISCIGAGIHPLHFYGLQNVEGKIKTEKGKDYFLVSISILSLGLAISAALIILSLIPFQRELKMSKDLKQRQEELQPVKMDYQNYLNAASAVEKALYFESYTRSPLDHIVEFINEMEEKMPSTFVVKGFSADKTGVKLDITVENKESAAKAISQFRTFTSVSDIQVASITELSSETGEIQISFSAAVVFFTEQNNTGETAGE